MDDSLTPKWESNVSDLKQETQASKRKKVVQKTVVTVKTRANTGKLKHEGPPSDFWSWRKYGQKPIKGSPHPRGYYRCSTTKGCLAKKQVERCRTDASMLIITYTSSHNHPGPDLHSTDLTQQPKEPQNLPTTQDLHITPKQERLQEQDEQQDQPTMVTSDDDNAKEDNFHYLQPPTSCPQDMILNQEDPFTGNLEKTHETMGSVVLNEEPLSYPQLMTFSTPKSEENDFFDELEELPTSSSTLTSFTRCSFFDERIPVAPS
ncbi:WRKY domain-containing protein [Cephalotus follicularis]|uniref:WRKY domain-containing protein n=1 Tax=Cephalotus follicularis TaxID=3775 RepID=A0A1Q3CU71_CEPFO|nr:WRKY domain-containing protein [Cephalotus follicularis]